MTRSSSSNLKRPCITPEVNSNPTTPPDTSPIEPTHPETAPFQDNTDLEAISETLHNNPTYLGNPNLIEQVKWVESGRTKQLALKTDHTGGKYEPAVLEWVGEISPLNFWLYACAGWNGDKGPNDDWWKSSPFETAKARANIRSPGQTLFASDWRACINNIDVLMATAKSINTNSRTALNIIQGDEVKIRHSIFERKQANAERAMSSENEDADDDDHTVDSREGSDLGPAFSIENIPCKFTRASEALERIVEENLYDFSPLPATSLDGKPILPADYEKRLAGATVLVRATMSSDYFATKGFQFYADVESITILRPPRAVISAPQSKSPSKKRRFELPTSVRNAASSSKRTN